MNSILVEPKIVNSYTLSYLILLPFIKISNLDFLTNSCPNMVVGLTSGLTSYMQEMVPITGKFSHSWEEEEECFLVKIIIRISATIITTDNAIPPIIIILFMGNLFFFSEMPKFSVLKSFTNCSFCSSIIYIIIIFFYI